MASKDYAGDGSTATPVTRTRSNMSGLPQTSGSRALASSRARDAFFATCSRELRWSLDREGRMLRLDGAWQTILGWQPEHLKGWYWEEIVHPDDRAPVREAFAGVAEHGAQRDIDMRLAVPAGGFRLTSWTFVAGSGTDGILGLGHDLPRPPAQPHDRTVLLERQNAKLSSQIAELEERSAAVERFAATAAHQLAEPLVIAESSSILVSEELGEDLDPMLRGRLDAIGRGAARARRLMDTLLADARSSGRPLELRSVELGAVVEATLVEFRPQIEERNASLVVGPLPRIRGESDLLSVVLQNLVSNAVKYGPRSGGRIEISAERRRDRWRVSVASEGSPIPADEARHVFQPFHRAPSERRVPGVGLGLTICTRLIERLGGTIGVEPGADSGNTFWIELRAAF